MSKVKMIVDTSVAIVDRLAGSENVKKFLCGTYEDGTARTLPDCLNNETMSPKAKKKKNKKKHNAKLKL